MSAFWTAASHLELGRVLRAVPLDARLTLDSGYSAPAALIQTDRGAWIVGAEAGHPPVARPLHENPTLRYEARVFGDRIHADGIVYGVPIGRSSDIKTALGAGLLAARQSTSEVQLPMEGRFIQQGEVLWGLVLQALLEQDEILLAWLETAEFRSLASDILMTEAAPVRYLLTDRRCTLVALNEVGQFKRLPLDALLLDVEEGTGRRRVRCGDKSWTTTRQNADHYRALAGVPEFTGVGRVLEVARLERAPYPRRALRLLHGLGAGAGPAEQVVQAGLRHELDEIPLADLEVGEALDDAVESAEDGGVLDEKLRRWRIAPGVRIRLVAHGVDRSPERASWYLPLHTSAHAEVLAGELDASAEARADILLAEHLVLAGEHERGAELLQRRLALLPDERLSDLLPPADADLTAGEAGQGHRIRTLELLAVARGAEDPDSEVLAELARLQPLVAARIEGLVANPPGDLAQRAAEVLALHAGLGPTEEDRLPEPPPGSLTDAELESLRHPLAREEGLMGWIQGWLAVQDAPDRSTLKRYCEQLSPKRHEGSLHALTSATLALGTPGLEAYISHGVLGHGLRAYEDDPSYLLIGGQHLYEDSVERMSSAELRFAVAAEVAHLRFQHNRVTSSEVWDGAVDKLKKALDLAATALSFGAPISRVLDSKTTYNILSSAFSAATLSRIYTVEKTGEAISTVGANVAVVMGQGADAVGKAQGVTGGVTGAMDKVREYTGNQARTRTLGVDQRQLVVAHRVMQLSADRAGLLLCGDIRAAVRAVFITGPDSLVELPMAEQHGLERALSRRGPEGEILHQDLAIRVGALLSFYLSDDYQRLRQSIVSPSSSPTSSS